MSKSSDKSIEERRKQWFAQIDRCKPEDFDGHTEFYRLTPEQRLDWLAQAVQLVVEFKGKARPGRK